MIQDALRRLQLQFWLRPALWTLGLGTLAIGVALLDSRLIPDEPPQQYAWLLLGNVDGARTMLGSIATAMLTVTSLTFSIFMVAIVQTANAYSPRILNEYISDTANQHVLGIMIGTFLYSLITLRDVRPLADRESIPVLTVNVALLLSLAAIFAFIYFLNHIAQSIKVSSIVQLLLSSAQKNLETLFPSTVGRALPATEEVPVPTDTGILIRAEESGYIQRIAGTECMEVATDADLLLRLECQIGEYVFVDSELLTVWCTASLDEEQRTTLRQAIVIGRERSVTGDLLFDLRQLSDMAIRALSAGINDPTTAVSCVDALTTLLVQLEPQAMLSPYRCDKAGTLRLMTPVLTFEEMVRQAFDQVREYGTDDVATTVRLLHACGEIAKFLTHRPHQAVLLHFVNDVVASAEQQLDGVANRSAVNRQIRRIDHLFPQERLPQLSISP